MSTNRSTVSFDYQWEPFTVDDYHYSLREHSSKRLSMESSSHWGAAIYKWQGRLTSGQHSGKLGVLIGETDDLRQRINQYKTGTQNNGNRYWREQFLSKGDIRLYVLALNSFSYEGDLGLKRVNPATVMTTKNGRVILEEILIFNELPLDPATKWIVNKWN